MNAPLATLTALSVRAEKEPLGTIALAVRDHINTATVISLLGTDYSFIGGEHSMDRLIFQGSILPLQRNEAIQRMRGQFLIFIDDDMTWPRDALQRIVDTYFELKDQVDGPVMVGGLCFRRTPPYQPTLYMREKPDDGGYRFLEQWTDGLVEVDATGCAFLLVPKEAIEAIASMYIGEPNPMPPFEARMGMPPPNIFKWEGRQGEDIRFCQDFKKAGGHIFVDTRIHVGHISEVAIGHEQYLMEIAKRNPVNEERSRTLNDKMGLSTLTAEEAKVKLGWT